MSTAAMSAPSVPAAGMAPTTMVHTAAAAVVVAATISTTRIGTVDGTAAQAADASG